MNDEHMGCGIRSGQIYTAKEIIARMKITNLTFQRWVNNGLRFSQPGTKSRYFLGDDLIAFMFSGKKT